MKISSFFFGQINGKDRPLRSVVFHRDLAVILVDFGFDDGQAQAITTDFAGVRLIFAVKTFEDLFTVFLGNANTVVCDLEE